MSRSNATPAVSSEQRRRAGIAGQVAGPPELLARRPDAVADLSTADGADLVGARWRSASATVVAAGADTVEPPAGATYFDDGAWRKLDPQELTDPLDEGRSSFTWYRTTVTVPGRIGHSETRGATLVFEVVLDGYAEIWIDGELRQARGAVAGPAIAEFHALNRTILTRDARPGQRFSIAVFGITGPISADPHGPLRVRSATLDLYRTDRAAVGERAPLRVHPRDTRVERIVPESTVLERVAGGFVFTEGPVWDGAGLLFSSPDVNTIYRWTPDGLVTVFRSKSGYTGTDIGEFLQPGSNGLTFDPEGRLLVCQHGNRRVVRVTADGDTEVLADRYEGRRLNSPNDLVCRSDGTVYFTDPPYGLPGMFDDPRRELTFSGVFRVADGRTHLVTDALAGPNGIAFSPDEKYLYVGDWDPAHKAVMRFEVAGDGTTSSATLLCDLTDEPGEGIDGMKVDRNGNIFACGPGGVWVITPEGQALGRLVLPEDPHNLAWGDNHGDTLYIAAMTGIYRMTLPTGGTPARSGPG